MILTTASCKTLTTEPSNKALYTEFDPPPSRPILELIPEGTTEKEALKMTGIYLTRVMTLVEKWEEHQKREDGYYTKVYIETK